MTRPDLAAANRSPTEDTARKAANADETAATRYAFLSDRDVAFLRAAADRLIPADDYPSASQAGVVAYIDGQLAGVYGRGERMYLAPPHRAGTPEQGYQLGLSPAALYRQSLDALASHPLGRSFPSQPAAQQDAFLRELEAGEWMLGDVPSAVFFETLLANVIEGYFADPLYGGNRDMAGWRMVGFPGAYAHFTQWVGQHNVRFNRPPMSIAMRREADSRATPADADPRIPESARPRAKTRETR